MDPRKEEEMKKTREDEVRRKVEELNFPPDFPPSWQWQEEVEKHFSPRCVEDISDFDRVTTQTFLIGLGHDVLLSSEEFDQNSQKIDLYYACLELSGEKPLAYVNFWKYPQGSMGQELLLSEVPFLPEHQPFLEEYRRYTNKYKLLSLSYEDLALVLVKEGRASCLWYGYFHDTSDDPLHLPF